MRVDLRAELDLLDDRLRLVLTRFPGLDRGLVLELAVVHELADRWPRGRRDLDEIEVGLLGQPQSIADGDDADLLTVQTDEPHLGDADPVVDAGFDADGASSELLIAAAWGPGQDKGPVRRAHEASTRPR